MCAQGEEALEFAEGQIEQETRSYIVDVAKKDELEWWVEQTEQDLGPADILISNTGGPPAGNLNDLTDEQWQAGFDTTVMNIVRLCRLVVPKMAERKWGRIVHITSLVAVEPSPMLAISSTLRAGLMALTKLQAVEYGPGGVTVNSILPGHTLTDRQTHLAELRAEKDGITVDQAVERQAALVPLKRLANPEEIAAAVSFLCSSKASYISGVSLLVDGGLTKGI